MFKILLLLVFTFSLNLWAQDEELCNYLFETPSWKHEITPANDEIKLSYHKGYHYRNLKKKEEKLLKSTKPEAQEQLPFVRQKIAEVDQELTVINDRFTERLHQIYSEQGIASKIETAKGGHKILLLDFEQAQPRGTISSVLQTVHERYGLKQTTVSLKENAAKSSLGFYSSHYKRMELGPKQGLRLLDEYLTNTGKHEARHAMFQFYRDQGIESIYHLGFYSSDKKLLNGKKFYDKYMSAEELYTASADLQKLVQSIKIEKLEKVAISQLKGKAKSLDKISSTVLGVSNDMEKTINSVLDHPEKFIRLAPEEMVNGSIVVNIHDEFERFIKVHFVSTPEKDLFSRYMHQHARFENLEDDFILTKLSNRGREDIMNRYPGELLDSDKLVINEIVQEFLAQPTIRNLSQNMRTTSLPIWQAIQGRLSSLKVIAQMQKRDGATLIAMIEEFADPTHGGKLEQLEEIKKLVSLIEKRVKEGYKGFSE